ncbi:hypothetical protein VNO77_27655 [Canavalia gladiata]|uniref:Uncharacterized protein n=1 Tax=Canavalia gladiata TaxID=3824 RepID=A0AAN9KXP3_CANGL
MVLYPIQLLSLLAFMLLKLLVGNYIMYLWFGYALTGILAFIKVNSFLMFSWKLQRYKLKQIGGLPWRGIVRKFKFRPCLQKLKFFAMRVNGVGKFLGTLGIELAYSEEFAVKYELCPHLTL